MSTRPRKFATCAWSAAHAENCYSAASNIGSGCAGCTGCKRKSACRLPREIWRNNFQDIGVTVSPTDRSVPQPYDMGTLDELTEEQAKSVWDAYLPHIAQGVRADFNSS